MRTDSKMNQSQHWINQQIMLEKRLGYRAIDRISYLICYFILRCRNVNSLINSFKIDIPTIVAATNEQNMKQRKKRNISRGGTETRFCFL